MLLLHVVSMNSNAFPPALLIVLPFFYPDKMCSIQSSRAFCRPLFLLLGVSVVVGDVVAVVTRRPPDRTSIQDLEFQDFSTMYDDMKHVSTNQLLPITLPGIHHATFSVRFSFSLFVVRLWGQSSNLLYRVCVRGKGYLMIWFTINRRRLLIVVSHQ